MSLNCNSNCVWKNPLLRDGTSQADRFLQALNPDYARIDEREAAEFLRFAFEYATKFNFYNLDNTDSGEDWQEFFRNDATATALVIREDLPGWKRTFAIDKDLVYTATNLNRKARFTDLLADNVKMLGLIESWLQMVRFGEVFRKDLERVVRSQIAEMLKIQIGYDLGAGFELNSGSPDPITLTDYQADYPLLWEVATTPQDTFGLLTVTADTSIYVGTTQQQKIEAALNYVEAVFEGLVAGIERLKTVARITLDMFLERWPEHEPHFALFLTFIQLFRFAQDHINSLTQRHLDLFYKEILQLEERKAIPDQVHVIFELASNLTQHLVPGNTGLDAAKDAIGKNLQYRTNDEIVVNQAQVASLKTVFLGSYKTGDLPAEDFGAVMFDAPVANSIDGLGAPLDKEEPRWKPFGDIRRDIDLDQDGTVDHTTMRFSRYGFAVSSPILLMQEGIREVRLKLTLEEDTNMPPLTGGDLWNTLVEYWSNAFEFRITGETGWMEPEAIIAMPINLAQDPVSASVTIRFGRTQEAVVKWDEKVHGRTYGSPWPVLEITLNHLFKPGTTNDFPVPYNDLDRLLVMKAEIGVNVKGVSDLVLQNDQGKLDPAKPFPPFTQIPSKNANFYIGSTEVFSKKLDSLTVDISWLDVPSDNLSKYYEGYGNWRKHNGKNGERYDHYLFTPIVPKTKLPRNGYGNTQNVNGDFKARLKLLNNFVWEDLLQVPTVTSCQFEVPVYHATISGGKNGGIQSTLSGTGDPAGENKESPARITTSEFADVEIIKVEAAGGDAYYDNSNSYEADTVAYDNQYHNYTEAVCGNTYSSSNNFFLFDEYDARRAVRIKVYKSTSGTPATSDPEVTAYEDIYDHCGFDHLPANVYKRDPLMPPVGPYTANTGRGFLKVQLANDFLHAIFPQVTTQAVLITSKITNSDNTSGAVDFQPSPNAPFTPRIKDVSLSYESTVVVDYGNNNAGQESFIDYDSRFERLYHILPFGEKEVFPAPPGKQVPSTVDTTSHLFPVFDVETTGADSDEKIVDKGYLYIGLKDLRPAQNLSLLFQFAEGTEDPSIAIPEVKWSFLSHNRWKAFQPLQILKDTTNGMVNSGIVSLAVPSGASNDNTVLPAGLHWLRVEAPSGVPAFSDLIAVHAQAVAATFLDQQNDPDHLLKPLGGNVIRKFLQANGNIKKVLQPYPSFGGRVREEGDEFYLRVSETLRHKHRAVTIWDYEHQILEEFPGIYKVKCINHTDDNSELAPGAVKVVLIPKVENYLAVKNPFELKVGTRTLAEVERFLDEYRNPFVDLKVQNPLYEKVRATFAVKFHQGRDVNYYTSKLITDIQRYLSPWAYGKIETIRFGGSIHGSLIINFIEELEYVDFLEDFVLEQYDVCSNTYNIVDTAIASTAASILVTAETHIISEA